MTLTLERRNQRDESPVFVDRATGVAVASMTPPIDEGYWAYRVRLSETQVIVGFPKFGTIGIGFAVEDDWNTNLPYGIETEDIFNHIAHNKGDDAISDDDVREAIRLVQEAAREDRGDTSAPRRSAGAIIDSQDSEKGA
jgi:hypothetical protein